ncbi:heavy metal translocating P-type ATPase [Planococcus faecalis]|uniref:Cd(2+)-exporting ATPase n=1 Tax=Planococcus faecalis TaxID=1598147 RepID=A0ABN4XII7_9BACL|nr:heavy metal translocating P-type ATPase [Planococcus faecalis]AQU79527.1 ATPase [Planococcus faecalis]OHX51925.1 ATPase [Planococcus faecalis]
MKVSEKQAETSCCTDTSCTSSKQPMTIQEKNIPCCETDNDSINNIGTEPKEQKPTEQSIETFTYMVQGMDCPSCAATIEKSLNTVKGIETVNINYSAGKMRVGVSNSSIADQIPMQVKKLGFETNIVETKKIGQVYRVDGMDCGACAVTIEKHLARNPAVQNVKVNFSTGKMQILHTAQDKEIIKEVERAGFHASLVSKERKIEEKNKNRITTATLSGLLLAIGFFGSLAGVSETLVTMLYAVTIILGGYKPARSAFYAVKSKSLDMNVLMVSAAIGAALIGEWFEGATVVWLFALGNALQNRSIERTRESIRSLINLAPSEALVKVGSQLISKPVEEVAIGDAIVVKPGEKIPLDGEIISGASSVNQAPITGESMPVDKEKDDPVYAGTINESGSLEVRVTKLVEDTTIAKIIHLVEEAQEQKAPTQDFVDRFARIYTPIVFVLALIIMVVPPLASFGTWEEWLYKGLTLLVVACPCALVISTPVAIVSAIGNAAKNGVLIKGGTFLEKAGAINAIAFDKTGTLTEGKPKVSEIVAVNGTETELISIARTIEEHSIHPIAKAIISYADEQQISVKTGESFKAIPGKGAQATINGVEYFAGNPKLYQEMGVSLSSVTDRIQTLQNEGHTLIVIGTCSEIIGVIGVADTIRSITVTAIQKLKSVGMEEMVMLTGDNNGTAKKIAAQTGVDRYFAELMPEDKVKAVKKLQQEGRKVAMVGDGINDAPALATADLGIAMGGAGTDTAMETADIVLMADNLEKLPHTINLSRKALTIIKQNVWFSLLTKVVALLLIFPGLLTLWMAVLADTGAALLVILNSMRLLRQK